jgi:hypothetical protein
MSYDYKALCTRELRTVYQHPFFVFGVCGEWLGRSGAGVVEAAVDGLEGRGAEVGRFYGFADEVGFAYPGALGVGEDDGYGVAVGLKC